MAVTSGFFNSSNHDRVYNNIQMGQIFDGIINDGVLPNFEDHLVVKSGSGMQVIVGSVEPGSIIHGPIIPPIFR